MTIGEIIALEPKLATVRLNDGSGDLVYFGPHQQSVVHGVVFKLGDRVSIRFARDNSRVASVVPAP